MTGPFKCRICTHQWRAEINDHHWIVNQPCPNCGNEAGDEEDPKRVKEAWE